jgi:hypothetical protein
MKCTACSGYKVEEGRRKEKDVQTLKFLDIKVIYLLESPVTS